MGRDHTIYATAEGKVKFAPYNKEGRKKVSIVTGE
jgi:ribosomal protein L27